MTYLLLRAGIEDEEDVVPCLLLKFQVGKAFTVLINAFHFNETVHRCAFGFVVPQIGNRCSICKESVMAHPVLTWRTGSQFDRITGQGSAINISAIF